MSQNIVHSLKNKLASILNYKFSKNIETKDVKIKNNSYYFEDAKSPVCEIRMTPQKIESEYSSLQKYEIGNISKEVLKHPYKVVYIQNTNREHPNKDNYDLVRLEGNENFLSLMNPSNLKELVELIKTPVSTGIKIEFIDPLYNFEADISTIPLNSTGFEELGSLKGGPSNYSEMLRI